MIGRTILHYEITGEIGAGGMGRVFRARDQRTGRIVALKFLDPMLAGDADARERFTREAQAAARLSHPGIVTLFGFEESGSERFLVQELIEGQSLRDRLTRGPLGTVEAWRLARELSAALAHAHAHGVLHRDLKPENVLVSADGTCKIADFGIAHIEGQKTVALAGEAVGTLGYMAPERLSGHAGDARSDLFSLGVVLYEAITGRRPFEGASAAAVMNAVVNEPPPPLTGVIPSLAPLVPLIERLLSKPPAQRPTSAEAVSGTIESLSITRPVPTAVRSRWPVPLFAAIAIVAAIAGVLWWRGRAAPGPGDSPAIAVLSFDNMADPADPDRLGAIAGNLLVTSLAQIPELNILSTQRVLDAVHQSGHSGPTIPRDVALAAARRARAERIVTGSILQTEPWVVTAEVTEVRTGKMLHATRVEGAPGQSILAIVDALTSRLLQRMAPATETARLVPVAHRTSSNLEAQQHYAEGVEALARGRMLPAQHAFERAVKLDAGFTQAWYQMAIALWYGDEPGAAVEPLERARAQSERLTPVEREMVDGLLLLANADYSSAQAWFERMAGSYPGEKLVLYGLVEGSYHSRSFDRTVTAARQALALDSTFTLVSPHLLDALRALGRVDEAMREGRARLATAPTNALLRVAVFDALVEAGDADGAMDVAHDALRHDAGSVTLLFRTATLEVNRTGRMDLKPWRTILAAEPALESLLRGGLLYNQAMREGRFRDAMGIARRQWQATPPGLEVSGPPVPVADGVAASVAAGDRRQALLWLDSLMVRLAAWNPILSDVGPIARVMVLTALGSLDEADRLERALSARGDSLGTFSRNGLRFSRAILREAQGRPDEALRELANAAWLGNPDYASGARRMLRAKCELRLGHHQAALATLDTVLSAPMLESDDAVRLRFHRAVALEKLGRPHEARKSYEELLALWRNADPGIPEVTASRAAVRRLSAPPLSQGTR